MDFDWTSLRAPGLVTWLYWWWALLALLVAGLYFHHVCILRHDDTYRREVTFMALGVGVGWFASGANKLWFGIRRLTGFPDWMTDHLAVVVISLMALSALSCHIWFATRERWPPAWLYMLGLSGIATGIWILL